MSNCGLFLCLVTVHGVPARDVAASDLGIEWATVRDLANPVDPRTNLGRVDHAFRIAKHNVTNAQYSAFLNSIAATSDPHSLYNTDMAGPQPGRTSGSGGIVRTEVAGQRAYTPRPGLDLNQANEAPP